MRGQGLARQLLRATLEALPDEFGCIAAALATTLPDIYRSVGFETCSTVVHWSITRSSLPAFNEAAGASEINQESLTALLPQIRSLYELSQSSQPGIFLRCEKRWKMIVDGSRDRTTVVWRADDRIEGYATYTYADQTTGRNLVILDMFASTAAARRGLIGYLSSLKFVQNVSGDSRISDLRKLGIQDIPQFSSSRRMGVMLAIADLEACLSAVASAGSMTPVISHSTSGLTIQLEKPISSRDRKPIRIFSVVSERLGVAIGLAPADDMTGDWISLDSGAMAQLFFGAKNATALHASNRLRVSSGATLAFADALFPSFDTYLGQLDS